MAEGRISEINEALEVLGDLEDAIHAHAEWVKAVYHALVFRTGVPAEMTAADAHRFCPFGLWYRTIQAAEVIETATYRDIDLIHHKVHEVASDLLRSAEEGHPDEAAFEAFTAYVAHLMDLLRRLEAEVWSCISTKDSLTGLYNRQAMDAFLKRAAGAGTGGSLALCDIDHFKRINDTFGHQTGDEVLRIVAQCILRQLRTSDTAYRYGGEEFLIHLGGVEVATAITICERLREAVEALRIPVPGGDAITVTISFGVAPLRGEEVLKQAVAKADAALYLAKNTGRNKVCAHAA
jgi:diguanylate cyclase